MFRVCPGWDYLIQGSCNPKSAALTIELFHLGIDWCLPYGVLKSHVIQIQIGLSAHLSALSQVHETTGNDPYQSCKQRYYLATQCSG